MSKAVVIDPEVLELIYLWAKLSKAEVGGPLLVEHQEGVVLVKQAALIPQQVAQNGMHVVLDANEMLAWEMEHVEGAGKEPLPFGAHGWWHSHVDSACFLSLTDKEFIEDHAGRGPFVSLVVNKKREMRGWVHCYAGGTKKQECALVELDAQMETVTGLTAEQARDAADQFEKKVTYTVTGRTRSGVTIVEDDDDDWWSARFSSNGDVYMCKVCCYGPYMCKKEGQTEKGLHKYEASETLLYRSSAVTSGQQQQQQQKKKWGRKARHSRAGEPFSVHGDFVYVTVPTGHITFNRHTEKVTVRLGSWSADNISLTDGVWKALVQAIPVETLTKLAGVVNT